MCTLETLENHRFLMFSVGIKGNIDPKWVKQLQYRQERHNLILFAWNVNSSIVKQNDCKNEATWLTQTTLSKSFSLFHATYIEDREFLKGLFFSLKTCFILNRLSSDTVFKFSKNVDLKIMNDPKKG